MYVPKCLQINVFKQVDIPDGRTLFQKGIVGMGSSFSPDEPAPMPMNKIDAIAKGMHLDSREMAAEAAAARAAAVVEQQAKSPAPGAAAVVGQQSNESAPDAPADLPAE